MASVKFLGHAAFELEIGGRIIITDPWLNPNPRDSKRLVPPAVTPDGIRKADLIAVSHEHFDHCDPFDLYRIQEKTFAHVLAPEATLAKLEKVPLRSRITAYVGDSFQWLNVDISVTPAKHPQSEYPVGYVFKSEGKSVYFAGDTYDFYEMSHYNPDVALLPIGGKYTMDVFAAIKAIKQLKCKEVVPMHYNTFQEIRPNLKEFEKRVKTETKATPMILEPGESFEF